MTVMRDDCTSLPTHMGGEGAPWIGQAHVSLMALSRLAKRQCGEMVRQVATQADLPEEVINDIVAKTDGVPLFVEELTKSLVAGGGAAAVPATIQAIIDNRPRRSTSASEMPTRRAFCR